MGEKWRRGGRRRKGEKERAEEKREEGEKVRAEERRGNNKSRAAISIIFHAFFHTMAYVINRLILNFFIC